MALDRRAFIATTTASLASLIGDSHRVFSGNLCAGNRFCAFVKFVQKLKPQELAETLKSMGYDGAELTVRPGGYITPEHAKDQLPEVHQAFTKVGLTIDIVTTSITEPKSPHAEDILSAIKNLGIPYYRMGFLRYNLRKSIVDQMPSFRDKFSRLAEMNRQFDVTGFYQNHSGAAYVGATFWDLQHFLKDIPNEQLGVIFDIRHACVEGGLSWPVYYNIIKPHILAFSMKDYKWTGLKVENVALGKGRVDPNFYNLAKRDFPSALHSIHVEYLEESGLQPNIEALRADLKTLKTLLG